MRWKGGGGGSETLSSFSLSSPLSSSLLGNIRWSEKGGLGGCSLERKEGRSDNQPGHSRGTIEAEFNHFCLGVGKKRFKNHSQLPRS